MRCGEASLVSEDEGVAISQRCRRWSCHHCLPLLRAGLGKRIAAGKPTLFGTIKAPAELRDDGPAAQQAAMVLLWAKVRVFLASVGIQYLIVVEANERGEPHWHIVMRIPFKPHSLAAFMRMLLRKVRAAGFVDVSLKPVTDAEGLGRYLSKDPVKFAGSRRFWPSRRWVAARVMVSRFVLSGILPLNIPRAADWMRRQGIAVLSVARHRLTFSPP